MPTTFNCVEPDTLAVKIDPCCTLVRQIDENEDIGDSLPDINFNFQNLEAHTCNLELSARDYWLPAWAIISANSANWTSVYSTVNAHSACWQSAADTVKQLSAAWLDPISVVYPYPFDYASTDVNAVLAWVTANFPIGQAVGTACAQVNHPLGQKLWVFTPEHTSAVQYFSQTVTPTTQAQNSCNFTAARISAHMTTINYGAGDYAAGPYWLYAGQSFQIGEGDFVATITLHQGAAQGNASCQAAASTVTGSFTDKYVSHFDGLEFCVILDGPNPAWSYVGAIPGY